ncbi:acyl-CoA dehydrogenase family protein [Pseudomonadales bacterium]|jgi:alkylation response protein AidB-like acyl-CoA dehydrogenase|nr:acyl-CoA dehydrogenase family protein [Pseudomonadales bacterium]MDB2542460.1 acyl-CoA dehydrogenase family protein [Pseudomonadales bacterium]MDC0995285.1 acyl-CoA dehydrogenase family protein [Pseudomonadales bacterium]MDG1003160.1 acyl-CoA dehydrogenase family protein [Pseudomonadales bacterium]MDG1305768.1 acyl-CoA dehydrogenase family protein [Pseudomonadales bacterium]|tara:strand:+ start:5882 stop:7084 length:1203 start_codon:yes stop_codon:yes gene_type:complete
MSVSEQELDQFRLEVSAWLRENNPGDPGFLLPESFMEVGTDEQFEYLRDWQRKVYDAGYLGMSWPEEYGGGGKPQVFQDIVSQEMARQRVPFMTNTIGLNWAGPLILQQGTEEDKKKYIKGILNADDIWCQGFSEPDHGSDLGNAQVKAVKDGDDYIINGSKIWTSLGSYAKYMILLARTSNEGPSKYAGLSFFLAPMKTEGIDPQPIKKLTSEYGFCQTFFNDARIPANSIMGREGEGWQVAMATLMFERGNVGGQAGGLSMMDINVNDVLELARRSKRNGKPALEDPLIRDQMVQFLIEAKSNVLMGARTKIPALNTERPTAIAMSGKLRGSELKRRFCQFAMSLQGANGGRFISPEAVDGGKWQRIYFNSFSATIGGGTTQVQYNIMGERVLGLPKS